MGRYDDILNYQYPNPEIERDFTDKIIRAAQFAPFAALTGHDEAIEETSRLTDDRIELDEYIKDELNRKLKYIRENTGIFAEITYFAEDNKKSGGEYSKKRGSIKKVREYEKTVVFDDGTSIPMDDIVSIESSDFDVALM